MRTQEGREHPSALAGAAAFLAVMIAVQQATIKAVTGIWGGTAHDPLWVGPVTAGIGVASGAAAFILHAVLSDRNRGEIVDVNARSARQLAEDLQYLSTRSGGPTPRPLRVAHPRSLPPVGMFTGNELPVPVAFDEREIYPVYLSHPMAVYELRDGMYTVTRNGVDWGSPFETTDLDLARVVCDRWAVEFKGKL